METLSECINDVMLYRQVKGGLEHAQTAQLAAAHENLSARLRYVSAGSQQEALKQALVQAADADLSSQQPMLKYIIQVSASKSSSHSPVLGLHISAIFWLQEVLQKAIILCMAQNFRLLPQLLQVCLHAASSNRSLVAMVCA